MKTYSLFRNLRLEQAGSLVELMVSLWLGAMLTTTLVSNFMDSAKRAVDTERIHETQTQAQAIADLIAFDLRYLGAGMPLGQGNFSMQDATLGTATLPLFLDSSDSTINFRMNEYGTSTILTADFDPADSLVLEVSSSTGFAVGDEVYVTDHTVRGDNGFLGTITGTTSTSITVGGTYTSSSAAVFEVGSLVSPITQVSIASSSDWSGVTRDTGTGEVVLAPNSQVEISYFDAAGTAILPPLTAAVVQDSLAAIRVVAQVRGALPQTNGEQYIAQAERTVSLRNLLQSR